MDPKVYETVEEMLRQRGYSEITTEGEITYGDRKICVFYNTSQKFGVDRVEEYVKIMNDIKIKNGIVVYKENVTPVARRVIDELPDFTIELFNENEMRYNITKHRLVPNHEKLSKTDTIAFKKQFGVRIPAILKTDPVARFYSFQRGDVIKITRRDGTISYRLVKIGRAHV